MKDKSPAGKLKFIFRISHVYIVFVEYYGRENYGVYYFSNIHIIIIIQISLTIVKLSNIADNRYYFEFYLYHVNYENVMLKSNDYNKKLRIIILLTNSFKLKKKKGGYWNDELSSD